MPRLSAVPIRLLLVLGSLCPALAMAKSTEVNVVVDFTPEGRKVAHPAPGNPAYYFPVLGTFEELGGGVAGEKAPKKWNVAHVVAVELAKQGYVEMSPTPYVNQAGQITYRDGSVVMVPAQPIPGRALAHSPGDIPLTRAMLEAPEGPYSLRAARSAPAAGTGPAPVIEVLQTADPVHGPAMKGLPNLILAFQYGYANPQTANFDARSTDSIHDINFNQRQMFGLVAGNSLDKLDLDVDREDVMARAGQDRYFVMVSAYDFDAYRTSHKVVLLWQAKMSAPSDSLAQFSDALNALAWAGGPYFGRETLRPEKVILPVTPDGHVEIGTATVKDYADALPPAPAAK